MCYIVHARGAREHSDQYQCPCSGSMGVPEILRVAHTQRVQIQHGFEPKLKKSIMDFGT